MPVKRKKYNLKPIGFKDGKSDLERMGVFVEDSYLHGKGYTKPYADAFNVQASKGRQMLPGIMKSRAATQDGYFDNEFVRIFVKEAYAEPTKMELQAAMKSAKKNLSRAFVPGGATKKHSSPGDYYGTFSGTIEEFSPVQRAKKKYVKQKLNFVTSPGKKGGTGYVDICMSQYPEHSKDSYDESKKRQHAAYVLHKKRYIAGPLLNAVCPQPFFDQNPFLTMNPKPPYRPPKPSPFKNVGTGRLVPPGRGKLRGGCMAGCFNDFPEYKNDVYKTYEELMRSKAKKSKDKKVFYPNIGIRPMPTCSTVNHNIDFRVNAKNWTTFAPVVYPPSMI